MSKFSEYLRYPWFAKAVKEYWKPSSLPTNEAEMNLRDAENLIASIRVISERVQLLTQKAREVCPHPEDKIDLSIGYRSDTLGNNGKNTYSARCEVCGKYIFYSLDT